MSGRGLPSAAEGCTTVVGAGAVISGASSLLGVESSVRVDAGGVRAAGSSGGEEPFAATAPYSRRAHAENTHAPSLEGTALAEQPPENWRTAAAGERPSSRATGDPARRGIKPTVSGFRRWRPHSAAQSQPDLAPSIPSDCRPSSPLKNRGLNGLRPDGRAKDAASSRRGPPPNAAVHSSDVGVLCLSKVEAYLRRCGGAQPRPPRPPRTSDLDPSYLPDEDTGGTWNDDAKYSWPSTPGIETRGVVHDRLGAKDKRAAAFSSGALPTGGPAMGRPDCESSSSSSSSPSSSAGCSEEYGVLNRVDQGAAALGGPFRQPVPVGDSVMRPRGWFVHANAENWNRVDVPASRAGTRAGDVSGADPDRRGLGSTAATDNVRRRGKCKCCTGR